MTQQKLFGEWGEWKYPLDVVGAWIAYNGWGDGELVQIRTILTRWVKEELNRTETKAWGDEAIGHLVMLAMLAQWVHDKRKYKDEKFEWYQRLPPQLRETLFKLNFERELQDRKWQGQPPL